MASSSACESCTLSTGSARDRTPPDATSLITPAPYLTCQRTADLHASAPSQMPFRTPSGGTVSGGYGSRSACPPRLPTACAAAIMRGPGTAPASIAFFSPTSMKSPEPRSRTVVKPDSTVRRAYSAAYCACSAGQRKTRSSASRYQLGPLSNVRCVCASISPGRRGAAHLDDPFAVDHHQSRLHDAAPARVEHARGADGGGLREQENGEQDHGDLRVRRSYHTAAPARSHAVDRKS